VVELTPEREYLLVTEFFAGATELGEAEVDQQVIDDGLAIIRKLWDAGLAHRDVKPANLLVRDGRMLLIDVAFVQAHPSPWRQAVDLANMMLCLALRSDPKLVYARALGQFSVEEITEAFAATRGLTMPSQLRNLMRAQGRDLHTEFLDLLPERPGARRYLRVERNAAGVAMTHAYTFPGGCVTERLVAPEASRQQLASESSFALGFTSRDVPAAALRRDSGGRLDLDVPTGSGG
jgi:serine/threonine protein kinase